jgi:uncharacterized protein YciI
VENQYVIIYTPGRKWIAGASVFDQPLREHGAYMARLYGEGVLVHGGPFIDDAGGMATVTAESGEEAQSIVDNDPAVRTGVLNASFHPWMSVDWSTYTR